MDRFNQMEAFSAVVQLHGFTHAARRLGISKAAVSKYVSALEEELGVRLLNRTTRRVSPTEEGRSYFEHCTRILEDLAEMDASIGAMASEPRGRIRLNTPMSFGYRHLAPVLADFMTIHPHVTLDVEMTDRHVDLVEEGFDVAVRIGELTDSTLRMRKLAPTRLVLCASPDYIDRHGAPNSPEDLERHSCLIYSYAISGGRWLLQREREKVRVTPRGRLRINNGDALREAALRGLGIAVLPTFIVGDDLRAGRLLEVLTDYGLPQMGIHAVWPETRHLSTRVRLLVDFLAERFGVTVMKEEAPCPPCHSAVRLQPMEP